MFADHSNGVIMSDKVNFYLHGFVKKQYSRYWAAEYSRELHQRSLLSAKERRSKVLARDMIYNFLLPQIRQQVNIEELWFPKIGCHSLYRH